VGKPPARVSMERPVIPVIPPALGGVVGRIPQAQHLPAPIPAIPLSQYEKLLKAPASPQAAAGYRAQLKSYAEAYAARRQEAEIKNDLPTANYFLAQESKVAHLLGDQVKVKELAPKLAANTRILAANSAIEETQKSIDEGVLDPQLIETKINEFLLPNRRQTYFRVEKNPAHPQLRVHFTNEFHKLPDAQKREVLSALGKVLRIGSHTAAIHNPSTPPLDKLFHQTHLAFLEGDITKAKLLMRKFKAEAQKPNQSLNEEQRTMLAEVKERLKIFSLQGIDQLIRYNEAFTAQRMSRLELRRKEHTADEGALVRSYLTSLRAIVAQGKADTPEEAHQVMVNENKEGIRQEAATTQQIQKNFETNPIIKAGMMAQAPSYRERHGSKAWNLVQDRLANFSQRHLKNPNDPTLFKFEENPKDPNDCSGLDLVRLAGGALVITQQWPSDGLRVVIGKEGGTLYLGAANGETYRFPPSDKERVVIFRRYEMILGNLREGKDFTKRLNDSPNLEGFEGSSKAWEVKWSYPHDAFVGANGLLANIDTLRPGFKALFELETQAGLEKIEDPERRRSHFLELAKQLRETKGYRAAAGEALEKLFEKPLNEVRAQIPQAKIDEIKKTIEAKRGEKLKEEEKKIAEFKKKQPELYAKYFGETGHTAEWTQQRVNQILKEEETKEIRKLAFTRLDERFEAGQLREDPLAQEAWKIYENMLDPFDRVLTVSDAGTDAIVDEVILTVATLPIAAVGAKVRAVAGAARLTWVARGGLRAAATRFGIHRAADLAENLANMAATSTAFGGEVDLKRLGFMMATSLLFRGGHRAFSAATKGSRIGEQAIQRARDAGERVLAQRAGHAAGLWTAQAHLGTAFEYVEDAFHPQEGKVHHSYWERLATHFFRQAGSHYGMAGFNKVTGGAPFKAEQKVQLQQQFAQGIYQNYRAVGFKTKAEAAKSAAQLVKDDVALGLYKSYLNQGVSEPEAIRLAMAGARQAQRQGGPIDVTAQVVVQPPPIPADARRKGAAPPPIPTGAKARAPAEEAPSRAQSATPTPAQKPSPLISRSGSTFGRGLLLALGAPFIPSIAEAAVSAGSATSNVASWIAGAVLFIGGTVWATTTARGRALPSKTIPNIGWRGDTVVEARRPFHTNSRASVGATDPNIGLRGTDTGISHPRISQTAPSVRAQTAEPHRIPAPETVVHRGRAAKAPVTVQTTEPNLGLPATDTVVSPKQPTHVPSSVRGEPSVPAAAKPPGPIRVELTGPIPKGQDNAILLGVNGKQTPGDKNPYMKIWRSGKGYFIWVNPNQEVRQAMVIDGVPKGGVGSSIPIGPGEHTLKIGDNKTKIILPALPHEQASEGAGIKTAPNIIPPPEQKAAAAAIKPNTPLPPDAGEQWPVVARNTGSFRVRPREPFRGTQHILPAPVEANPRQVFRRFPDLAKKWRVILHPDGSITFPNMSVMNQFFKKFGFECVPVKGDVDSRTVLTLLGQNPPKVVYSELGKERTHDFFIHMPGYLAILGERKILSPVHKMANLLDNLLKNRTLMQDPRRAEIIKDLTKQFTDAIELATAGIHDLGGRSHLRNLLYDRFIHFDRDLSNIYSDLRKLDLGPSENQRVKELKKPEIEKDELNQWVRDAEGRLGQFVP
jgi:hypothetical protein